MIHGKKLVIFDMDGTLIDSEPMWVQVDKMILEKRGVQYDREKHVKEICGKSLEQIISYYIEQYKIDVTPAQLKEEMDKTIDFVFATQIEFVPGAEKFLQKLRSSGKHIAIASACPHHQFDLFF